MWNAKVSMWNGSMSIFFFYQKNMMQAMQQIVYFYGHKHKVTGYLSNFADAPFSITQECIGKNDLHHYQTSEHAIMHFKACLMEDYDIARQILIAESPHEAKRLGRQVTPWDEEKWKSNVHAIAYAILTAKFSQNPSLLQKLRSTGNSILAEAAPYDIIWGIGLSVKKAQEGDVWRGENLLGETLMQVRRNLT